MRKEIHRALVDIPSHSFDDPEVTPRVRVFDDERVKTKRTLAFAKRMLHTNKEVVMIQGRDGHKRPVTMSKPQAACYKAVVEAEQQGLRVSITALKDIFANNTVDSLLKNELLLDAGNNKVITKG